MARGVHLPYPTPHEFYVGVKSGATPGDDSLYVDLILQTSRINNKRVISPLKFAILV